MSQTNKSLLLNSGSTQFQSGAEIPTSLLPTPWSAVTDTYYKQMRTQNLDSVFNWEAKNYSIVLPRSLNCVSNIYLKVTLPDLGDPSHHYKFGRGKYVLESMSFRSNGVEVYRVNDYSLWIRSYEESLSLEELRAFRSTFLGCDSSSQRTHVGSTCFLPLPIPNTRYFRYPHSSVNWGCMPMRFGNSVTEIVLSVNPALQLVLDATHAVGSIQNACAIEYREIIGKTAFQNSFSEGRGSYSVAMPERIALTADFENVGAGVHKIFKSINPTGNVFALEFDCKAQTPTVHLENDTMTRLTFLEIRLDNEIVIHLDEHELKIDQYSHGYRTSNDTLTIMPRVHFNTQGSKATVSFRGSIDFRRISNLDVEVAFKDNCKVKLYSMRYSRVILTAAGEFKKYLD